MKKFVFLFISTILIILLLNWHINDIQRLQGDELLMQSTSPEGGYTLSAYLNKGNATTDHGVLVQCRHNANGRTRNIYWQYHCYTAEIRWINEHTALINGQQLDVRNDTYRNVDRE